MQGGFTVYESGGFGVQLSFLQLLIILVTLALIGSPDLRPSSRQPRSAARSVPASRIFEWLLGVDAKAVVDKFMAEGYSPGLCRSGE